MKRTALFETHQKLGGRLIEFGGWEMPVQYASITREHQAVRAAAGLFDISHMGEFLIEGSQAEAFLNSTLTNDPRVLAVGQGQYTLLCNERGGAIDDLYAYRLGPAEYLLIVNASRIAQDFAWLQSRWAALGSNPDAGLRDLSDELGAVAVQGPKVASFIDAAFPGPSVAGTTVSRLSDLKKNRIAQFKMGEADLWIGRTGYTGEDGFEIVAPSRAIVEVWNRLMEVGASHGLVPAGLGARDTLRTEMCYPLYGQELDENTTPIEAALGFFVALDQREFPGSDVLASQKAGHLSRKLVAFKMTDKCAPPRPHYPLWSGGPQGVQVGQVSSGTQSPSLGIGIGMGYVPVALAQAGNPLAVEIRGHRAAAVIVPKPLYRKLR